MLRQKAQDIMSALAVTVFEVIPVSEIVNLFSSKGTNRVSVVDSQGILVGIFARADIL
jgi:CBS-domain-containing membrane protein